MRSKRKSSVAAKSKIQTYLSSDESDSDVDIDMTSKIGDQVDSENGQSDEMNSGTSSNDESDSNMASNSGSRAEDSSSESDSGNEDGYKGNYESDEDNDEDLENTAAIDGMDLQGMIKDGDKEEELAKLLIGFQQLNIDSTPEDDENTTIETPAPKIKNEWKFEIERCSTTLQKLMESPTDSVLKKTVSDAYYNLSNFFVPQPDEFPQCVYLIVPSLKPNFKFSDSAKELLYAGSGVYTRPLDHFILSQYYQQVHLHVKKLKCVDPKFEKLMAVFNRYESPLLIRIPCISKSMALALEAGVIDAFDWHNIIGNKTGGTRTTIPLELFGQPIIDAGCGALIKVFNSLSKHYDSIMSSNSATLIDGVFFERINLPDLISRFKFPVFGDCKWTKTLLKQAENSTEFKEKLGDTHLILSASMFLYRTNSDAKAKSEYFRENSLRARENVYPLIFGKMKPYSEMFEDEVIECREMIKKLSNACANRLKIENPDKFEIQRLSKLATNKKSYYKHRDKILAKRRVRFNENMDSILAKNRASYHRNKSKRNEYDRKRNATTERKEQKKKNRQTDSYKVGEFRRKGNFKNKVYVQKGTGKQKCNECKHMIGKNVIKINYFNVNFCVKCLVKSDKFRFNVVQFKDWVDKNLLSKAQKQLIETNLVVNKFKQV